jgi:hypothetical protein
MVADVLSTSGVVCVALEMGRSARVNREGRVLLALDELGARGDHNGNKRARTMLAI